MKTVAKVNAAMAYVDAVAINEFKAKVAAKQLAKK